MHKARIENAVKIILEEIGEQTDREGIKYTPTRVARLYSNLFYAYSKQLRVMNEHERNTMLSPNVIPITVFKNTSEGMIIRRSTFNSFCEHHLVPFTGEAWVGIIPGKKMMGMNKIDKVVKYFAAQLQVQERMTSQVADWLDKNIKPQGVIVVVNARHQCAELQGDNGDFTTSEVRGIFANEAEARNEFLKLMRK